jgi:hypothetical protein
MLGAIVGECSSLEKTGLQAALCGGDRHVHRDLEADEMDGGHYIVLRRRASWPSGLRYTP